MTLAVMRRIGLAGALLGAVLATPAGAQMFSDGFEFLKAVKDRDGDAATQALNEPGTTVVNARDLTSGQTALHIVVERRDLVWTKFLLQRGANPNIRDKKGVSPLQLAVGLGFVDGVDALLHSGAEIDVNDKAGETPLIAAVHRRDVALIRLLLSNGADPDRTDNSGRSARDYADLAVSNRALVEEFVRADDEKAGKKEEKNYGPTF